MIFILFCVLVLWTKVASVLEGLDKVCPLLAGLVINEGIHLRISSIIQKHVKNSFAQ